MVPLMTFNLREGNTQNGEFYTFVKESGNPPSREESQTTICLCRSKIHPEPVRYSRKISIPSLGLLRPDEKKGTVTRRL